MTNIVALADEFQQEPNNRMAEQAVLGSIMVNNAAFAEVAAMLRPDHFYDGIYGAIFKRMGELISDGKPADPITLAEGQHEPMLHEHLSDLMRAASSIVDAATYASLVRSACHKRMSIAAYLRARHRCTDPESNETIEIINAGLKSDLELVAHDGSDTSFVGLADVCGRLGDQIGKQIEPMRTGLPSLDRSLGGGLRAEDLYVIEAPAKAFKTGTMGTIALQLIRDDVPFLFVSLEMAPEQIMARLVSAETGCNARHLMDARHHESALGRVQIFGDRYGQRKCYFADRPGINADGLAALCSSAVAKFGISVIFIDYWQLIGGKARNENMADHLEQVAYWAAAFARKNGVAVVMASQLNRQGESLRSAGIERACSWLARLKRCEQSDISGPVQGLWMEIPYSRFAEDCDIGSETNPAFRIDGVGPVLKEIGDWGVNSS